MSNSNKRKADDMSDDDIPTVLFDTVKCLQSNVDDVFFR